MNFVGIPTPVPQLDPVIAQGPDPVRDAILAVETPADARKFLDRLGLGGLMFYVGDDEPPYAVLIQTGAQKFKSLGQGATPALALLDARPNFPQPPPEFVGPRGKARNAKCACGSGRKAKKCHPQGVQGLTPAQG